MSHPSVFDRQARKGSLADGGRSKNPQCIDQAEFDELLRWLDPDPEMAAQKYESIRRKLIASFSYKRCVFAEDLADETFNRVARKLPRIKEDYCGNPLSYFFGVARKIHLEQSHRTSSIRFPRRPPAQDDLEEVFERLDDCLRQLPTSDRELILNYFQADGREKIQNRKRLAEQLGIPTNLLRIRVHRIICRLRKGMNDSHRLDRLLRQRDQFGEPAPYSP